MQSELTPIRSSGWHLGFGNLVRRELSQWFGTRTWFTQAMFWGLILGGVTLMLVGTADPASTPEERITTGLMLFTIFGSIFPAIAIIIFSTSSVLEEKERGTAAWVLSKPVSRTAFVLAKMFVGVVSYSVSLVLIPGLIVFSIIYLIVGAIPLGSFLLGLGPMILWYTFVHFLCVCLGTVFNSVGPVAGPASVSLFFVNAFDLSGIGAYTPWTLSFVARDLMQGLPITSISPVISTLIVLIVLLLIAIWRFGKEEF
ncbi:MAG: ABC transporter permease subunit [Candidatus Thorarchaeota archaeon]|nr:ABC transporter permease subunit [Candidatus Thorarchaeota archaeon]